MPGGFNPGMVPQMNQFQQPMMGQEATAAVVAQPVQQTQAPVAVDQSVVAHKLPSAQVWVHSKFVKQRINVFPSVTLSNSSLLYVHVIELFTVFFYVFHTTIFMYL